MNHNEQFMGALPECEAAAKQRGHALGVWHAVDERLHASLCKVCGRMAWLTRSGNEKLWRIGGSFCTRAGLLKRRLFRGGSKIGVGAQELTQHVLGGWRYPIHELPRRGLLGN
jgi:hypothetical protein